MRALLILCLLSAHLSATNTNQSTVDNALVSDTNNALISDDPIIQQIHSFVDARNSQAEVFKQALQHPDITLQKTALLGLARIGDAEAVKLITPAINHNNLELRKLAALGLGLSGDQSLAPALWQRLQIEKSDQVKHEIYLALGNLGEAQLISKMMQRLALETSPTAQASLFQGLAIALTFHRDLTDDYSKLDYPYLVDYFSADNDMAARAGYFLTRIPKIEQFINATQLIKLTTKINTPLATQYLARLISKVTIHSHQDNRALLAWVIEATESPILGIKLEATAALKNFFEFPQTLIQLGKLQASAEPIVAQTALKVIADSEHDSDEIVALLKQQLKNKTDAMVVAAMSGLIRRQTEQQMSWVVTLFKHPSAFVKIQLMGLLTAKSATDFAKVIQFFSNDPNPRVSQHAKKLVAKIEPAIESQAESPSYQEALAVVGKKLLLKTSNGEVVIELLDDSPYTAWHFVNNAKQGNFNHSYFSRVIGNFVAQGGDREGDGNGSSGLTIREEINLLEHQPMTVAMATSGKDTGTSQFFINTARNLHLDRNYTIFARVIKGQQNIYRMTNGSQLLSVEFKD